MMLWPSQRILSGSTWYWFTPKLVISLVTCLMVSARFLYHNVIIFPLVVNSDLWGHTLLLYISYSSSNFHTLIYGWLSPSYNLYLLVDVLFHKRVKLILPFTYLFILVWTHVFLLHSVDYNPFIPFIFMFQLSQIWSLGAPSIWPKSIFNIFLSFIEWSLLLWHKKMFQAHLMLLFYFLSTLS